MVVSNASRRAMAFRPKHPGLHPERQDWRRLAAAVWTCGSTRMGWVNAKGGRSEWERAPGQTTTSGPFSDVARLRAAMQLQGRAGPMGGSTSMMMAVKHLLAEAKGNVWCPARCVRAMERYRCLP